CFITESLRLTSAEPLFHSDKAFVASRQSLCAANCRTFSHSRGDLHFPLPNILSTRRNPPTPIAAHSFSIRRKPEHF
ncbi:hypothetical protein HMPREF1981_02407, partial [Bacteroides pyogenes F0041]